MHFTIFQHVLYESPGYILDWIRARGYRSESVDFYNYQDLPDLHKTENLIVMGGPMNIHDDHLYPWLPAERDSIRRAIQRGNRVLGICLGSQLIADALGARVFRNDQPEIGWFEVEINQDSLPEKYRGVFPDRFTTLHWHSDTFELPGEVVRFAGSEATVNQAFLGDRIAGIQFHLEMTPTGIEQLISNNTSSLKPGFPWVQKPGEILEQTRWFPENQAILYRFLDKFFS